MIGTAEDHHSTPPKIAIGKFKRKDGRDKPFTGRNQSSRNRIPSTA